MLCSPIVQVYFSMIVHMQRSIDKTINAINSRNITITSKEPILKSKNLILGEDTKIVCKVAIIF